MPPIKGRMIGRMGSVPSVQQSTKQIRNVQKTTVPRRKYKSSPIKASSLPDNITDDHKLMSMRMPEEIVRILPSVKKYKGGKDFVDLTDINSSASGSRSASRSESEADGSQTSGTDHIIGLSNRGRGLSKYAMKQIAEDRFMGIIFDVGISPTGDVFVCCCEGAFKCDETLDRKKKLEQIVLPGGITFFKDGRVVVICRNQDTVNFFTKDGIFIKAFKGGFSPMGIIMNSQDELLVSDPGEKAVHVFDTNGEKMFSYPTAGRDYCFRWPLYMGVLENDSVLICDCHAQNVVKFGANNKYKYTYKLKTSCGNQVLRPHGIATNQDGDLFVIDTTMDTVEVFTPNDCYLQTLINVEEGNRMKPKCLAVSPNGLCVIGGRLGMVRIYQFLDSTDSKNDFEKTPVKQEYTSKTPRSRQSSLKRGSTKSPREDDVSKIKRNVFNSDSKEEVLVKMEEDEKSEILVKEENGELNLTNNNDVIVLE